MEINIQTPHFSAKDGLIDFVKEHLNKLTHFSGKIIKADVYLKLENITTGDNKICEIRIFVAGGNLFASNQCATFEEATVKSIKALEKQIKHQKEKAQG